MSRKVSGLAALILICSIYIAVAYPISLDGRVSFAEIVGAILGLLLFPALLASIIGLIAGAFKEGAFKLTLFWSYVLLLPLLTVSFHIGAFLE